VSVRYNEPIACIIRISSEQFGVAALPFAPKPTLVLWLNLQERCRVRCMATMMTQDATARARAPKRIYVPIALGADAHQPVGDLEVKTAS
jgi:hypothetical protein